MRFANWSLRVLLLAVLMLACGPDQRPTGQIVDANTVRGNGDTVWVRDQNTNEWLLWYLATRPNGSYYYVQPPTRYVYPYHDYAPTPTYEPNHRRPRTDYEPTPSYALPRSSSPNTRPNTYAPSTPALPRSSSPGTSYSRPSTPSYSLPRSSSPSYARPSSPSPSYSLPRSSAPRSSYSAPRSSSLPRSR